MTSLSSSGFQGSEHTGCIATFYPQGSDIAVPVGSGAIEISGRSDVDDAPCLIAAQTTKHLGGAGTFNLVIKTPPGISLFDLVLDDDWVDIVFTRHGSKWHVLRGLVDEVRLQTGVGGSGATNNTYTVSGRDFQKIFDTTPIWFDQFTSENLEGGIAMQVFSSEGVGFSVEDVVDGFLNGFLKFEGGAGRANWSMPGAMPNLPPTKNFIDAVNFDYSDVTNAISKTAVSTNLLQPEGMVWELASQWSDPLFYELYTEQCPSDGASGYTDASLADGLGVSDTSMTVVLRDRPFVVVDPATGGNIKDDSPWFKLPLYSIPREHIVQQDMGRGGFERYNAFFCSNALSQELVKEQALTICAGNWDPNQMLHHGIRIFQVVSPYQTNPVTDLNKLKAIARDWYCINPYLYNGSISLAIGRPDIKVGTRCRIPGVSMNLDQTFYIEGVSHQWALPQGMRTSLALTRGFIGSDSNFIDLIQSVGNTYEDQKPATAGATSADA